LPPLDGREATVSEDATGHVRRRLAAILFAGYNRLQPGDAADTFAGLILLQTEIIEPQVLKCGGNIIRWTGDGTLIEFESVVEAVRCAAALRDAVAQMNQALQPDRRIALRIGINLDDIIVEYGDVFGDGVNIAARLGTLAEPGSVYVSEIVYDRVAGKVDFDFDDLGPKNLKNISRPIRVYRMAGDVAKQSAALDIAGAVSPAGQAGVDDRHTIAVLPFLNFSGDPDFTGTRLRFEEPPAWGLFLVHAADRYQAAFFDHRPKSRGDGTAGGPTEQAVPRQPPKRSSWLRIDSDVEIAGCIKDELERAHGSVPYCEGEFWRYDGTHWEPIPSGTLRRLVHSYDGIPFGERGRVRLGKNRIGSILKELSTMLGEKDFFPTRDQLPKRLCLVS
jgi:class 3 adenylate cyclase